MHIHIHHTYIHTYKHTYIPTYIHSYTHVCMIYNIEKYKLHILTGEAAKILV